MPKDYVDCYSRGRQQKASAPSILYVSTGALSGARLGPISATWDDVRKTKHEIGLIDNVFARLPYQVLYKPYPSTVYLDPSPIQEHTEKTGNVTYYKDNFDLRYILSQSSVIVTSRSTSTMGWCLAPDVPLVFIDLPNQIPPQKEFLEHLRKSVFYFDGAAPDLEQRLVEFLSRPLTVIEEEWRAMSGYREIMLDQFFGSRDGNAGRNAAAHILKFEAPSPSASFGGDTK
jgi:hypothetical protein